MPTRPVLDFSSPAVDRALLDVTESLHVFGRDSRVVRAAITYSLWKKRTLSSLAQYFYRFTKRTPKTETLRVFYWLPGGLGDVACARRLVSAYRTLLPTAQFEIFSPVSGAAQAVFSDIKSVTFAASAKRYWKDYDLVVQACLAAKFLHVDWARVEKMAPSFIPILRQAQTAQDKLGILLEDVFLTEPVLGRWLYRLGGRRFDLLSYTSGVTLPHDVSTPLATDGKARQKFGLTGVNYLTFHDGALGEKEMPTRMWPTACWQELLGRLKQQFPNLKIVQLGAVQSPKYQEADVCLVGKTELTDLPDLLAGSRLHIDSESGLVHLAALTQTPSVVLFGPSDVSFFGYERNMNLSAGNCGGCMWAKPNWMKQCPLGHTQAPCMQAISVEQVLAAVREKLNVSDVR